MDIVTGTVFKEREFDEDVVENKSHGFLAFHNRLLVLGLEDHKCYTPRELAALYSTEILLTIENGFRSFISRNGLQSFVQRKGETEQAWRQRMLQENREALVPFIQAKLIKKRTNADSYAYSGMIWKIQFTEYDLTEALFLGTRLLELEDDQDYGPEEILSHQFFQRRHVNYLKLLLSGYRFLKRENHQALPGHLWKSLIAPGTRTLLERLRREEARLLFPKYNENLFRIMFPKDRESAESNCHSMLDMNAQDKVEEPLDLNHATTPDGCEIDDKTSDDKNISEKNKTSNKEMKNEDKNTDSIPKSDISSNYAKIMWFFSIKKYLVLILLSIISIIACLKYVKSEEIKENHSTEDSNVDLLFDNDEVKCKVDVNLEPVGESPISIKFP